MLSIQELGKKFVEAGRLKLRPLCVYGTNDIPQTAIPSHTIDRGIAKAVYTAALFEETPPLYVDASHEQCCPRADGLRLRRVFHLQTQQDCISRKTCNYKTASIAVEILE